MKKNIKTVLTSMLAALLVFPLTSCNSQDSPKLPPPDAKQVVFVTESLEQALAQGKQLNKPVIFEIFQEGCPHCEDMARFFNSDTTIAHYLNRNFIMGKTEKNSAEGEKISRNYNVSSYPLFLIYNVQGEQLEINNGMPNNINFKAIVQNIIAGKSGYFVDKSRFLAGNLAPKDSTLGEALIKKAWIVNDPSANSLINATFDLYPNKQHSMLSEPKWEMLRRNVYDSQNKMAAYVMENKDLFRKTFGDDDVNNILKFYGINTMVSGILKKDETLRTTGESFLNNIGFSPQDLNKSMTWASAQGYYKTADPDNYTTQIEKYFTFINPTGGNYAMAADNLNKICAQGACLTKLVEWCEKGEKLAVSGGSDGLLAKFWIIRAKTALKNGDKQNAKMWAEKSLAKTKELNLITVGAGEFLKELEGK
ncbi:MAG: DUF255 domain-containing protein [Sphingobacteriales bacterium]|nr:DUF255 domain-containing protein [Sphingobacteriales bacterium]